MKYIVIDLEMNPIDKKHKKSRMLINREIVEIGAIALDEQYKEIDRFKMFVKPYFNNEMTKNVEMLTGIKTGMLWSQPDFAKAMESFFDWCDEFQDKIVFYEWSDNDLDQILKEMIVKRYSPKDKDVKYLLDWRDLQEEYGKMFDFVKPVALKEAILNLGLDVTGHLHDALCDVENTVNILKILHNKEDVEQYKAVLESCTSPKEECVFTLGDMFDFEKLAASA